MGETEVQPDEKPGARFGLRLASWYAVVFVVTSLAIVLLTYRLLAASLEERDQQLVISTLREYSQRYADGGLASLADAVDIEQRSGRRERMFVRVVRVRPRRCSSARPMRGTISTSADCVDWVNSSRSCPIQGRRSSRWLRPDWQMARYSRSARAVRTAKRCSRGLELCWPSSRS